LAARLGNVLYWTGCILAGLIGVAGLPLMLTAAPNSPAAENPVLGIGVTLAVAVIVWLAGRAMRYILAGT
jgi:hypothetical protein